MAEAMQARVREAAVTMNAVDGDSLLSPRTLARIVSAVMAALEAQRDSDRSRRSDTRTGDCGCGCGERESAS